MASSRFRQWLTSRHSEVLLVNGNADTSNRCSPVSFACGLLVSSLGSFPSTITLSFFCALHTDSSDPETGSRTMLASLVGQLLEQYQDFELSFLTVDQKYDLRDHEIGTLCSLFKNLLREHSSGNFRTDSLFSAWSTVCLIMNTVIEMMIHARYSLCWPR